MARALKLTEKGQITLKKEYLQHLGVMKGEYVEILKLPNGTLQIKAGGPSASLDDLVGILAGKSQVTLTVDEINKAIEASHVEAGMQGIKP